MIKKSIGFKALWVLNEEFQATGDNYEEDFFLSEEEYLTTKEEK